MGPGVIKMPNSILIHPILRIKEYLYMILLFTACRSLKYPLSGKKNPYPFLYIGPIS